VASAAIADAGIAMNGLGVGTVIAKGEEGILLDPLRNEEHGADGMVSLGVMPALGNVSGIWMTGEVKVEEVCQVSRMEGY